MHGQNPPCICLQQIVALGSKMAFENLTDEEAAHLKGFIKHFVESHKQNRWKTVLSMNTKKWQGASAYDCNQPEASDWNTPLLDTIEKLNLAEQLDKKAFIFKIGHSGDPGVYEGTLKQALLSEDPELECIISIIPGKLAISYGHSNEFRLCKRT